MSEYITLMGSEQVSNAGHAMTRAAEEMKRAAGEFEAVLFRHHQFMDDWLVRFQTVLEESKP